MTNSVLVSAGRSLAGGFVLGSLALGLAGSVGESAYAQTFQFDWDRNDADLYNYKSNCSTCFKESGSPIWMNDKPGVHETISTTYNSNAQKLSWTSTFSNSVVNGGWLVISDGPNPKQQNKEFAIFYLDGLNNQLTAYAYNGQNNSNSWQSNPFLQSWDDALTFTDDGNGNTALSFSIDASAINARNDIDADWKGVTFGEEVGIWFHAAQIDDLQYGADGQLTKVDWGTAGWYDTNALETEKVPEPTLMLGMIAAGGLGILGRKRSKAS